MWQSWSYTNLAVRLIRVGQTELFLPTQTASHAARVFRNLRLARRRSFCSTLRLASLGVLLRHLCRFVFSLLRAHQRYRAVSLQEVHLEAHADVISFPSFSVEIDV